MYSDILFQITLVLGFLGYVAATNPGCAYPCVQLPPSHQEPWLCPVGIPQPPHYYGKWPTPEEENSAKALIGPVAKQQSDGKLYRAAQNAQVTLSLVSSNPLTVKVRINNNDAYPITFWTKYSPLSQYAFDYGYFKISAPGQQPIAAGITPPPEGYRPETAPDLSVILPGEALETDIVLNNPNHVFHQMVKNGGDIEISMAGLWNGFWPATAPEVMNSDLSFSCNNIWGSLGLTWSSCNKLLLRFPKQHYVSSEPHHSAPINGEPESSAGSEPLYGDNSSRVSSDIGDEAQATSGVEQSESTAPKDKSKSDESYASGQPTAESSEYISLEKESSYSSTVSSAAESAVYSSLPTESSEDQSSTSASQSALEEVATTPAPFVASYSHAEEEPKATSATQSWTTMASATTKTVSPRLVRKDCRDKCKEDCKCKHPEGSSISPTKIGLFAKQSFESNCRLQKPTTPGVTFGEGSRDDASGYRPVFSSFLTEVGPGSSVSSRIKLPYNPWLKMLGMSSTITMEMYGSWYGIWAGTKKEVMASDVNDNMSFWNDIHIPWDARVSKEPVSQHGIPCSAEDGSQFGMSSKTLRDFEE
ncbi:hypothetical protein FPCIR_1459 [Fusarium pseudocircinatum]|uniref:Uncharacterized protein n=1 Tax=Fusarium pseudocircinatum TaxID=56676 RepID=A0A8H5PW26_9HYPO|nr:hypothetical protein FPCIR_1459 [Fusarium pseudocircinatum]